MSITPMFIITGSWCVLRVLYLLFIARPSGSLAMVLGILVGVVGMVLVALAYPVYNRVLKTQRAQIAPEVLRLSEELLK